MNLFKNFQSIGRIIYLVKKDAILELRQLYSLGGVLLYLFSSVFIVYKIVNTASPMVWNAIFWILFLFVAVSALLKSFAQESGQSAIFYYSLFNPYEVLLAKLIFNFCLMVILSAILFICLNIFFPIQLRVPSLFFFNLLMTSLGISISFSFISAISVQGGNNATLMAILSFPVTIPILLIAIKISAQAIGLINDSEINSDILLMLALNLIMLGLSIILFPFLWKS